MPNRLELADIQGGVLHALPLPYRGTYVLLRIDDRRAGRELLRRITPALRSAENPTSPDADAWLSVSITFQGLKALGVPRASLDSFATEFREGMRARAARLSDTGESAPEHWEYPLGSPEVHVGIIGTAPDEGRLEALVNRTRDLYGNLEGVTAIYRQNCYGSASGREAFGYKDNISHPHIEGSGIPPTNSRESSIKAGEFVLGYENELGQIGPMPMPDELGRNGTYLVFRKLHQRVAAFRQYLHANSDGSEDEELLAAKIMGRWRSGAPLVLTPEHDDPQLGADPTRNNDFLYLAEDDARGLKCPFGSHVRRMNPRDGEIFGDPRIHRLLRREASYGPPLPDGALEDDGVDRGILFACVGASIRRQFEFVQGEWANSGVFIGQDEERDPLVGANDESGVFTIPERPIRRRLKSVPHFVVTRGGEYFFLPGLRALRWLADLDT